MEEKVFLIKNTKNRMRIVEIEMMGKGKSTKNEFIRYKLKLNILLVIHTYIQN